MKTIVRFALALQFIGTAIAGDDSAPMTPDASSAALASQNKVFKSAAKELDSLSESNDSNDYERLKALAGRIGEVQIQLWKVNKDAFKSQREQVMRLWLRVLAVVSHRMDPRFDPTDAPPINIQPPPTLYPVSGMAPEGIKDPKMRREYTQALQKNREKAQHHTLQTELRELRDLLIMRYIFPITRQCFRLDDPEAYKELEKLMKEELNDEELREWLTKRLEEMDAKY